MRLLIIIALLALLAGTSGCTNSVEVKGRLPTPLVARIPARVGVFYPAEFRDFRHDEAIEGGGTWDINLGKQNHAFFGNLFAALFREAREMSQASLATDEAAGLDGMLIPHIDKYEFLTPSISGLNFYSASIKYRLALYDRAGMKVGEWRILGYGKSEGSAFKGERALSDATRIAIRDGGARVAIELAGKPAVQKWLSQLAVEVFAGDAFAEETELDENVEDETGI